MPAPVPILLCVRELHQGGCESDLTKLAIHIDRTRFEPHVASFYREGMRAGQLRAAGLEPVTFPVRSFRSLASLRNARAIAAYVRRHGIRLIQNFDVPTSVFVTAAARSTGALLLNSQLSYRSLVSRPYRWLLRLSDRLATALVVNCHAMRRHVVEDEGVPASRVHVCFNGIDTSLFHPRERRRRAELQGAPLAVGVVAALRPEKGLTDLIDAFARARLGDARLVIIGSGAMLPVLTARAEALGIAARALFVPATSEVPSWLRSIDVFALPSRSEALSNALMEAMACGCAPIASRVGGNPELVEDGANGCLFPAGDVDRLADCLAQLGRDAESREAFGRASAAIIEERFSLRAYVTRMEDLYATLLRL
ncbi:MAG TPA: hypothetical protein DEH78_00360 [Solibacterales bacterium]|nr:hypothetical protein [Bryobacterales bacterium]